MSNPFKKHNGSGPLGKMGSMATELGKEQAAQADASGQVDTQQREATAKLDKEENLRRRRLMAGVRGLRMFRSVDPGRAKPRTGAGGPAPASSSTSSAAAVSSGYADVGMPLLSNF